jgi:hypothetical protein
MGFQCPKMGGRSIYISQLLIEHYVSVDRQIELHTAESLVPGPSCLEVGIAIAKLGEYKSPSSDEIPAILIQAGGETLLCVIHKLVNSVWNKEELPDEWKEPIIVAFLKRGAKPDCKNYLGISLLSNLYKSLSNILPSGIDMYIDEINGDCRYGFQHRSTTDRIFCVCTAYFFLD